ncbi:MAG: PfkB family carbohydrate kinase [Thermoguttaceae bacterium]|jgi:sugar/nucleoside kinase (ribokinase family)
MNNSFDILGLGCTAVDELLYLDAHPAPDTKAPIRGRERQCGGLTHTALVAAARMGCRCAYAGMLGDDELSRFVVQRLIDEGIDAAHICRRTNARPVRSTILVDRGRQTRTILYDVGELLGADSSWPHEDLIRGARVLLVDHFGMEGMIRAARIARDARIPVVADLESADDPLFPTLVTLVDHLILSRDFALKITDTTDPALAARSLWTPERQAVVVTCGRDGCWYVSHQRPAFPCHQPALPVEAIDTTGCGDVFHGAYAAAIVHGLDIPMAVRFASVAAGLKAKCPGGQAGIPTRSTVEAQMDNCVEETFSILG